MTSLLLLKRVPVSAASAAAAGALVSAHNEFLSHALFAQGFKESFSIQDRLYSRDDCGSHINKMYTILFQRRDFQNVSIDVKR